MTAEWGPVDALVGKAEALAGAWGARARGSTTIGQERAILRLFGVTGVDAKGRPLAGTTVDRWLAADPRGLPTGIALPFAMALLEYDLEPQQLALDVASGAIDLALEGELLRERDRRAIAEVEATRLAGLAVERIDAQRTVRRETIDMLGEAPRPWLGVTLREPDVVSALDEAMSLIGSGIDLIRIEVPIGRELADRLADAGVDVPIWQPRDPGGRAIDPDLSEPAPTGSQRALTHLRRAADRAAARRRAYVRLATDVPAFGAPEGAVVAAFERIDVFTSDAMAEIVADGVEPDRALADHAFAHRLVRRAGSSIVVGPGPLVVAPDLSSGVPSDPATRAGRALALQLLGVALARTDGLAPDQVIVGALPPWVTDETAAAARAIAEVSVRRAIYPGHPLGFVEPPTGGERANLWPYLQAAAAVHAGETALVLRTAEGSPEAVAASTRAARSAADVAASVAAATEPGPLRGVALDHARGMVAAATATLDRLADVGWRAVSGEPPAAMRARAGARESVIERTEAFDPFASSLGPRD
jgi:beta-lysine 5,6-aminomutase alpha subunit